MSSLCPSCVRSLRPPRSGGARFARRLQSTLSASDAGPLRLAIIGAGPSGFYTASRILQTLPADSARGRAVRVDMYERLPTPYGLVRYGVAPDHPEVKNCQHKFDELSSDSRFRYFGNVSVGSQASSSPDAPSPSTTLTDYTYPHALHIPLSSLLPHYSSILLTYGASLSNPLRSVAGSSSSPNPLGSVYPALALVSWYNGHPAFQHLAPDLKCVEDVAVIGHGNVALDVARILLKDLKELEETDMPISVLEVLGKSDVRRVTAVGRRGPGQVAFTTKEFREMLNLSGVSYHALDTTLAETARPLVEGDRMRKRLLGLMEKSSSNGGNKEFHLDFLKSPKSFLGDRSVEQVEWTVNELLSVPLDTPAPPTSQAGAVPATSVVARGTEQTVTSKADMVVESVGYRSEPLGVGEEFNLPFDGVKGRLQNVGGRITAESGEAVPGMYAAGWAARGPVGVIASTMHDAYSVAALILDDHFESPIRRAKEVHRDEVPEAIASGLKDGRVVDLRRWQAIDVAEQQRARDKGSKKEREKFISVEEMLSV